MFTKLKVNVALITLVGIITTASITSPFTSMFGKHYKESKDFACCKKDQLVLHHYYTVNVFWLQVTDGFTEENMGKALAGGCNIKCND